MVVFPISTEDLKFNFSVLKLQVSMELTFHANSMLHVNLVDIFYFTKNWSCALPQHMAKDNSNAPSEVSIQKLCSILKQ